MVYFVSHRVMLWSTKSGESRNSVRIVNMQAIVTAEPVVLDFEMMRFIKLQNNVSLFWCFNGLNFLISNEQITEI